MPGVGVSLPQRPTGRVRGRGGMLLGRTPPLTAVPVTGQGPWDSGTTPSYPQNEQLNQGRSSNPQNEQLFNQGRLSNPQNEQLLNQGRSSNPQNEKLINQGRSSYSKH